jgi:hypothetical protein
MRPIDAELKEFLESGLPAIVGSGDAGGRPHIVPGWSPRVVDANGVVDVFLDAARAERTLANLKATGRIAVTVVEPVSARSLQLKGTFRDSGDPDEAGRAWVQQGREAFLATASLVGDPPAVIESMWMDETVRVTFEVEQAFDQTPGPGAGKAL